MLVLAVHDALAAYTSFPAWVDQILVRPSSVERDVRLEFSDHVGEGAEGMSDPVAALLQKMDDAVAEVDVPDLEQAHLVLAEPETGHQEQGGTVALVVLSPDDRIESLRFMRLSPPVGRSAPRALDREHGVARDAVSLIGPSEEALEDGDVLCPGPLRADCAQVASMNSSVSSE